MIENKRTKNIVFLVSNLKSNNSMNFKTLTLAFIVMAIATSCGGNQANNNEKEQCSQECPQKMKKLVGQYVQVPLTSNIDHLSANEKQMLALLFDAAYIMDDIFWTQNFGDKSALLGSIKDTNARLFAEINYGPWDQFDNQSPFIEGYGKMPAGAGFYPTDMTKEEFDAFDDPNKTSLYTLIQRDENGKLKCIWYHEAYKRQIEKAAHLLKEASLLAGDKEFANYLQLRAEALATDNYFESDMAWMDVRNNNVDMVIGPIENYVDALYGYKAAHEAFILIKDLEWSNRLSHYAQFLPELQKKLPADAKYLQEVPGVDADLAVYDAVFYGGDCNMAGKTIAINLPNDEKVQLQKGTRKLQLKNSMKAKFDNILVPIAGVLMSPESRANVNFNAFFANTMFHEVAHGMGIKNTLDGSGTVRNALKEQYSAIEEAKADVLGLYLVTLLSEMGEYTDSKLIENYTTFMAGIFRSVRFGAASAHGKANMLTFNFFEKEGAFTRSAEGMYSINFDQMKAAVAKLGGQILSVQGDGNYEVVKNWIATEGVINPQLQGDLNRINEVGVPVDIYFEMGPEQLGL